MTPLEILATKETGKPGEIELVGRRANIERAGGLVDLGSQGVAHALELETFDVDLILAHLGSFDS